MNGDRVGMARQGAKAKLQDFLPGGAAGSDEDE